MSALTETPVTLTDQSVYPADPDVICPFVPDTYTFINTSSAICHASFDGKNDHVFISPSVDPGIAWDTKTQKVWLRRDSAGMDAVVVTVMAGTNV